MLRKQEKPFIHAGQHTKFVMGMQFFFPSLNIQMREKKNVQKIKFLYRVCMGGLTPIARAL